MSLRPFALLVFALSLPVAAAPSKENFEVQKLADGVYAVVRQEPPGLSVDANDLFIINDRDVIVVDTSVSTSETKKIIAALRKLTSKPVRYVINTHPHDDHVIGDPVYRDEYPGVEFISTSATREALIKNAPGNRKGMFEGVPGVVEALRDALKNGKNLRGEALSAGERKGYVNDIAWAERYLLEVPKAEIVLPTVIVDETLTFHRGDRAIEIRRLGRGHTAGDLVVWLPKEKIVATGDAVIAPVPLIGGDQSFITDWASTLGKISALGATTIVPGHGAVMHDDAYVKSLASLFKAIGERTAEASKGGVALDEARKKVDLSDFEKQFAGDDPMLKFLFAYYVKGPGVAAAYREKTPG